jgi:hypothetical protein
MELTPDIVADIDQHLKKGLSRESAAEASGVPVAIMRQWLAWGAEGKAPYDTWLRSVKQSEAKAVAEAVTNIRGATQWQAKAWWLERKDPERWGQKVQLEVKQELDKFLNIASQVLPAEWYEKLLVGLSGEK